MRVFLRNTTILTGCLGVAVWIATARVQTVAAAAQAPAQATAQVAERPIDYNWDVRPILSDNCFRCHGNDEKGRQAGLRLDEADSAFARRPGQRERYAIVPGNPDASELMRRITATTAAVRMPPAVSNKVLTPDQVDIIRRWIAQGAQYKPHWSYIAAVKATPPSPRAAARAVNEIDRFVLARLEREGLTLSSEADRETLINRVSLTLTGLPPTLAEVDAFVNDRRPDAYERLVDRLLASTAYGEHMAGYWMNLARWADTDGFLDDHHDRFLWPWRDWVIGAFNRNMPWNQFSTWQIAGDLLPNATKEQQLATAFLRVGPRTTENGAIDEEYRVEYVVDRTNTIGAAFLGLTTGCARCHSHKYDVISHKDYYSLAAFFNNADEPGFYPPGQSTVQAGPTLLWPNAEMQSKLDAANQGIRQAERAYEAARATARAEAMMRAADVLRQSPAEIATMLRRSTDAALTAYYPFDEFSPVADDELPEARPARPRPTHLLAPTQRRFTAADFGGFGGRGRPTGPAAYLFNSGLGTGYIRDQLTKSPSPTSGVAPAIVQAPVIRDGVKGKAVFFDEENRGFLGKDVGYYERTQPFTLDFWFFQGQAYTFHPNEMFGATGKGLPYGVPVIQHRDGDGAGGSGYRLQLEDGHLWVYLAHSRPANMIALKMMQPFPVKEWVHVTLAYDGSSRAAGTKLFINGVPAEVDVDHDTLTRSMLPLSGSSGVDFVGLSFGSRFREKTPVGSGLDEIRVFNRALTPVEVRSVHEQTRASGFADRAVEARELIDMMVATDPGVVEAAKALTAARDVENQVVGDIPQVLVFRDAPKPRDAFILNRGVYSERGEKVTPQGLERVFPWNPSLPKNRLGLAQWLFDPKHPLTARVFVNRMWQMHFGQGIVETAEDFGSQGSLPTHPELLDWLAVSFVESGWDLKKLHKTIVMSATYRQTSDATEELLKRDPQNRLLTRGLRQRMPAEMVRDNALSASGLLVRTIGGPSVYPYQPENIWNSLNSSHTYPAADAVPADEHHRRSLYTFVKRNATHPGMVIFDFPDRNASTVRRRVSNTPLQGLELMNDPQFVEAYRVLAVQALAAGTTDAARLTHLYRVATRRSPTTEQLGILREYLRAQGQRYIADPAAAKELLATGVTPAPADADPTRLAAMTMVTALVMNSPDAYSIR